VDLAAEPRGPPCKGALCQSPACSTSGLLTRVRRAHPARTALTSPGYRQHLDGTSRSALIPVWPSPPRPARLQPRQNGPSPIDLSCPKGTNNTGRAGDAQLAVAAGARDVAQGNSRGDDTQPGGQWVPATQVIREPTVPRLAEGRYVSRRFTAAVQPPVGAATVLGILKAG
jgi:hypothetical protein